MCASCDEYERTKSIEGMYYPKGTVQLWCFVNEKPRARYVTVSQPIRVSEIGIKTFGWGWGPSTGSKMEVCKLEFSDQAVYTHTENLYNTGRFEYHDRDPTVGDWFVQNPIILFSAIVLSALALVFFISQYFPQKAPNMLRDHTLPVQMTTLLPKIILMAVPVIMNTTKKVTKKRA